MPDVYALLSATYVALLPRPTAGITMMQSLGAATLNEFKRTHKQSQTDMAAAAAVAAATAVAEAAKEAPSVTARLDLLLEKKRSAVLGPSKISTSESRGEREYQVDVCIKNGADNRLCRAMPCLAILL